MIYIFPHPDMPVHAGSKWYKPFARKKLAVEMSEFFNATFLFVHPTNVTVMTALLTGQGLKFEIRILKDANLPANVIPFRKPE